MTQTYRVAQTDLWAWWVANTPLSFSHAFSHTFFSFDSFPSVGVVFHFPILLVLLCCVLLLSFPSIFFVLWQLTCDKHNMRQQIRSKPRSDVMEFVQLSWSSFDLSVMALGRTAHLFVWQTSSWFCSFCWLTTDISNGWLISLFMRVEWKINLYLL